MKCPQLGYSKLFIYVSKKAYAMHIRRIHNTERPAWLNDDQLTKNIKNEPRTPPPQHFHIRHWTTVLDPRIHVKFSSSTQSVYLKKKANHYLKQNCYVIKPILLLLIFTTICSKNAKWKMNQRNICYDVIFL